MKDTILNRLRQQHQELEITIKTLERFTAPGRTTKALRVAHAAAGRPTNDSAPSLKGYGVSAAIPIALKAAGKPMRSADLCELLKAGEVDGKPTNASVGATLWRLTKNKVLRKAGKKGWVPA